MQEWSEQDGEAWLTSFSCDTQSYLTGSRNKGGGGGGAYPKESLFIIIQLLPRQLAQMESMMRQMAASVGVYVPIQDAPGQCNGCVCVVWCGKLFISVLRQTMSS